MQAYAELHCHTNFSFLDGASAPDELAERADEAGGLGDPRAVANLPERRFEEARTRATSLATARRFRHNIGVNDARMTVLHGLIAHMNDGVFAETDTGQVAVVNASFTRSRTSLGEEDSDA